MVQTGVQILSAFLLTLPFTNRFSSTTDFERALYVLSLVAAAVTTALVLAPVSYHRRHHELGDGEGGADDSVGDLSEVVRVSVQLTMAGMITLMLAAVSSILLAIEIAVGLAWAGPVTGAVTVVFIVLWYFLPLGHGRKRKRG
ncbi:MAG: hypothetical protein HOW97_39910 [Catenulispora sp.]|nr:hypothetical protein [Catenulispora sp.]